MTDTSFLVQVQRLKKYFSIRGGIFSKVVAQVKAVDDVSLQIAKGEILALVGESGCGKTTVGRLILGLMRPTSGDIVFEGVSLSQISKEQLRLLRRHMQIIFQDPYASLNPRMSVGEIIGEPLLVHGLMKGREKEERVAHLMETVGLDPRYASRYPHEFSGGQRQRVGIARALALHPKLIVCDEAVSALDVSIQAQVINLLEELQEKFNLTYLFISHDLSVVKHISNRVAVMYLGKLVETAPTEELYGNARHPYTRALLSAVPVPDPDYRAEEIPISGEVPSPIDPPPGCRFHTRCFLTRDVCRHVEPELQEVAPGHLCACHVCD